MLFNSVVPEAGLQGQERIAGGCSFTAWPEQWEGPMLYMCWAGSGSARLASSLDSLCEWLLSSSQQLSFVCNLPPLNKAMQNPLIAFNHFPLNSPGSKALFKAYRLKSISTKPLFSGLEGGNCEVAVRKRAALGVYCPLQMPHEVGWVNHYKCL